MAERYQRTRYNRRREGSPNHERDDHSWRQQEQLSGGQRDWNYNDYEEGYGHQMSDPYRRNDQEDIGVRDRNERFGSGGQGYSRRGADYASTGEYNYGPAYYDTGNGRGFTSFTSEDQGGRDFSAARPGRDYRRMGRASGYGGAARADYENPDHERGFFERAGDEIASWFGDEDAAHRREMDHTGRGPAGYTRSDERILEDACDNLTDDWAIDASNVQVTVKDGELTLDGTVPTRQQKRRAEDCVEDISGVRHVQNNLRVQERTAWDRSDESAQVAGERTTGTLT